MLKSCSFEKNCCFWFWLRTIGTAWWFLKEKVFIFKTLIDVFQLCLLWKKRRKKNIALDQLLRSVLKKKMRFGYFWINTFYTVFRWKIYFYQIFVNSNLVVHSPSEISLTQVYSSFIQVKEVHSQYHFQEISMPNMVICQRSLFFQLLSSKDYALMFDWNSSFLVNPLLDWQNCVWWMHIKSDIFLGWTNINKDLVTWIYF